MMPPFGPAGDPTWGEIVNALLVPLFLLSACASVVWGLQDRYNDAEAVLRELAREHRQKDAPTRAAALVLLRVQVRRARFIHNAVVGFYLTMLLQMLAASWVGILLLGWARPTGPLVFLFEASLVILFVAILFALGDVFLAYRGAEEEARDAGLLGDLPHGKVRAAPPEKPPA